MCQGRWKRTGLLSALGITLGSLMLIVVPDNRCLASTDQVVPGHVPAAKAFDQDTDAGGAVPKQDLKKIYNRAVNAYEATDYALAIRLFRKILNEKPNHARAHLYVGLCRKQKGRIQLAIGSLDRAITNAKRPPVKAWANTELGGIYLRQERYSQAEYYFSEAIRIYPGGFWVYYHRCRARYFLNKYTEAENDCGKMIKKDRECPWPYSLRGKIRKMLYGRFYKGTLEDQAEYIKLIAAYLIPKCGPKKK